MTICMNVSRFMNLAAIFSLDLESQFSQLVPLSRMGLFLFSMTLISIERKLVIKLPTKKGTISSFNCGLSSVFYCGRILAFPV